MHLTVGEKSLLAGDAACELLIEYARLLGQEGSADSVSVNAISSEGNSTTAMFLLNSGTTMAAESVDSGLPEPDNAEAEEYLRERIEALTTKRNPPAHDVAGSEVWNREEP